jgi:outer membrane protein with beta-barrel domain
MPKLLGRVAPFALVLSLAALLPATSATAAEIAVHVGTASPTANWGTSWGGSLTISLFSIVHGEIEGAYIGSDGQSGPTFYTAAAKAYLGPTIGRFVPYGGIGAGLYHENLPVDDDEGTTGLVFAGVKLKFPMGLVLRGEYQWVSMPDAAPVKLDSRYFFGVGLSF